MFNPHPDLFPLALSYDGRFPLGYTPPEQHVDEHDQYSDAWASARYR